MAEFSFQYDVDFPDSVRDVVEPLLENAKWLFPLWMQKAILTWNPKQDGAMAEITLQKDYRWCRIVIFPDLLSVPYDVQQESVLHEIIHCYNVPLKKVACDILDECIGDDEGELSEKLQNVFRKQIDSTMESVTQDLTFAIQNKFYKPE